MGGPLEENDPSRHWSAAAWGSSRNVRVRRARLKGESGGAEEARLVAQLRVDDTHPAGKVEPCRRLQRGFQWRAEQVPGLQCNAAADHHELQVEQGRG